MGQFQAAPPPTLEKLSNAYELNGRVVTRRDNGTTDRVVVVVAAFATIGRSSEDCVRVAARSILKEAVMTGSADY